MAENKDQRCEEQVTPEANATETLLSQNESPSSTNDCCANAYGYFLYSLLGLFLLNFCIAAILGGGRFGLIPVISRTGSLICLGIAVSSAVLLLVISAFHYIFDLN